LNEKRLMIHRRVAKAAEKEDFSLAVERTARENYISPLGILTHHGYK
jgi:hypothetical protein